MTSSAGGPWMTSPAEGPRLSMREGRPRSRECTTCLVGPTRSLARMRDGEASPPRVPDKSPP